MIGILIIAHDSLAEGLARAVTHVLGSRPPQFEVLSVAAADDPAALLPAARELVRQLDTGTGVLIFSDIFGASPSNLAGKLLKAGRVEGYTLDRKRGLAGFVEGQFEVVSVQQVDAIEGRILRSRGDLRDDVVVLGHQVGTNGL